MRVEGEFSESFAVKVLEIFWRVRICQVVALSMDERVFGKSEHRLHNLLTGNGARGRFAGGRFKKK